MEKPQQLFWIFFVNKNNRMLFLSIVVVGFLIAFPFVMYELYVQTRGLLNLSLLDRKQITAENYKETLIEVDNYFGTYSLSTSILETQLEALNQIPNSDIYINSRKIHLIKIILQKSWFPNEMLYLELAKIYFNLGYYKSSLHYLSFVNLDSLSKLEQQIEIVSMKYKLNTYLGDFKNAIIAAQQMLEFLPNSYKWTYELALSYIKAGEYLVARVELEKLVSNNGEHPEYLKAMFTLLELLKTLNLETKIDFYYHYLATVYIERGEEDFFLGNYAKHLVLSQPLSQAMEIWKVPYSIIKDKKNVNKNLKNNFIKYFKL